MFFNTFREVTNPIFHICHISMLPVLEVIYITCTSSPNCQIYQLVEICTDPKSCPFILGPITSPKSLILQFPRVAGHQNRATELSCNHITYFWIRDLFKSLSLWHQPLHYQYFLPPCVTKFLDFGDTIFVSIDALFFIMNTRLYSEHDFNLLEALCSSWKFFFSQL